MGAARHHGPGRRLDVALGGRLCPGVGAPYGCGRTRLRGHDRRGPRCAASRWSGGRHVAIAMGLGRQVTFWIATCVVIILVMWLLRGILLPFVAGMALAYLFNPLANRLERL